MHLNQINCEYIGFSSTLENPSLSRIHKINQDYLSIYEGVYGKLFIISRGIGESGAEIISHLAVVSIVNYFKTLPQSFVIEQSINDSFQFATTEVLSYLAKHKWLNIAGASIALLLSSQNQVYLAHAGDCRIYLIRDKKINLLTSEHVTFINSDKLNKNLSKQSNIESTLSVNNINLKTIDNTIGLSIIEPAIIGPFDLYKNDHIILATKGVYQRLTRFELLNSVINTNEVIVTNKDFKDCITDKIVQKNTNSISLELFLRKIWELAKNRNAKEDFSLIIIKINHAPDLPEHPSLQKKEKTKFFFLLILFLSSLLFLVYTILPLLFSLYNSIVYR